MRWPKAHLRPLMVGAALVVSLVVAALAFRKLLPLGTAHAAHTELPSIATDSSVEPVVALTDEKRAAAGVLVEPADTRDLAIELSVPGRIEANIDRQVDIRTRTPGVIRSVSVVIGQNVKAGDLLITLDSADVASARLNLRSRQRELTVANTDAAWRSEVAANVEQLIAALRKHVPAASLEAQFRAKPLGNDRALLMAAYAEWEIARDEEEKQGDLYNKQIVGEHAATLAVHARESAQAKFEAALEQVRYDAQRLERLANQQVRLAESAVTDAAERIRVLGIPVDLETSVDRADEPKPRSDAEPLTTYEIVAPFDGTIVARTAVPSVHVEPADALLTLVDLTTVRVLAHVSESEFAALPRLNHETIRVTAVAYPGREFSARVISVGAQVDPMTRTVPLLAETSNADGHLKLGMFVRITLDRANGERATTVPTSAVTEIDGQSAVFVSKDHGKTFTVRPVTLGRESDGRQAVVSGLVEGEPVAVAGTFVLKSELLLHGGQSED